MNDQIPFTPDLLRYGKDKRESNNDFWKELLIKFDCKYYEVKSLNHYDQVYEIEDEVNKLFYETCKLGTFERT